MNPEENQSTPPNETTPPTEQPVAQPVQSTPEAAPATYPGKTLGIVGFILSFITNPLGLILSIIAFVQSKKAGIKNNLALAGIIIGSVFTLLGVILIIFFTVALSPLVQKCQELGPGVHYDGSTTITCH